MSDDNDTAKRSGKKKARRLSNDYQTPEYITCDVTQPITHMENGKPSYTDYLITTAVWLNCPSLLFFFFCGKCLKKKRKKGVLTNVAPLGDFSEFFLCCHFTNLSSYNALHADDTPQFQDEKLLCSSQIQRVCMAQKSH
jgi:hypothetical protein